MKFLSCFEVCKKYFFLAMLECYFSNSCESNNCLISATFGCFCSILVHNSGTLLTVSCPTTFSQSQFGHTKRERELWTPSSVHVLTICCIPLFQNVWLLFRCVACLLPPLLTGRYFLWVMIVSPVYKCFETKKKKKRKNVKKDGLVWGGGATETVTELRKVCMMFSECLSAEQHRGEEMWWCDGGQKKEGKIPPCKKVNFTVLCPFVVLTLCWLLLVWRLFFRPVWLWFLCHCSLCLFLS